MVAMNTMPASARHIACGGCRKAQPTRGMERAEREGRESVRACLMECGCAPRAIEVASGSESELLAAIEGIVGGRVEMLDAPYGDDPVLYFNADAIDFGSANRAVLANERMVRCGCRGLMDRFRTMRVGELYAVLFGDVVAVSHRQVLNPVTGCFERVACDISDERLNRVCEDFADVDSGAREACKAMLAMEVAYV